MVNKNSLIIFLDALRVEKALSINTISAYKTDIQSLDTFLSKRKPKRTLTSCDEGDLLDYIKNLNKKSFSSKSQSRQISAIKQFYIFCYTEKIVDKNPAINLKNPKLSQTLPKSLTVEEINKLLQTAKKENNKMFYTMLELLYATGLRVSELVGLPLSALIEDSNFILVKGKGNKERIIPLGELARSTIKEWLQEKTKTIPTNSKNKNFLFPSLSSLRGHITRERFAQILKKIATKSGIAYSNISPHVIRHSFASHILNNGGDLKSIQSMLGHTNLSTTEIYTHVLDTKLKEAVLNNHPLSKNKSN